MNRTEAYLRRATRGLWGAKRREVREELEAHLADGLRRYRLIGCSENEAVTRVLADLGHPREVASGMARLYTLPYVAAPTMLLAALAVFAVLLVSESAAQNLEVIYRHPTAECLSGAVSDENCGTAEPWTSLAALKAALEPQGARLTLTEQGYLTTLELPGGRTVYLPTQTQTVSRGEDGAHVASDVERGYFSLWELFQELGRASGLPLRFGAWGEPEVHLGDLTLRWNVPGDGRNTWNPYDTYMSQITFGILMGAHQTQSSQGGSWTAQVYSFGHSRPVGEKLVFRMGLPGTYGLIAMQEPATAEPLSVGAHPPDVYALQDVAPMDAEGVVRLGDRTLTLEFVATRRELLEGEPGAAHRALLVRLSGEAFGDAFGYEIVPPDAFEVVTP